MNDAFPFLYQHRLNELVYLPEKTIIQAGPGMGKSVFIEKLKEAFIKEKKQPVFVKGSKSNKEEGVQEILEWCQSGNEEILLIDNLDHIYNNALEHEFRDLNSSSERIIIATSCTPTRAHFLGSDLPGLNELFDQNNHSTLNSKITGSLGLSSFASMWLSPWDGQWVERITVTIRSVLSYHALYIKKQLNKKEIARLLIREMASITNHIMEISGGHPVLLHRTINTFVRQLLSEETSKHKQTNEDHVNEVFLALIPTITENCSPRIYIELEWAESLLPPTVYRTTLEEVILEKIEKKPHNANGERVLRQAGILNKKGEKIGFVCDIVREVAINRLSILEDNEQSLTTSENLDEGKNLKVILDSKLPDNSVGRLIFQVSGEPEKTVELSPVEWGIIVYLEKNEGKLVTVKELIKELNPDSEASIRSALQRLTNKLTAAKLQNLITNIPRKGYLYNASFIHSA